MYKQQHHYHCRHRYCYDEGDGVYETLGGSVAGLKNERLAVQFLCRAAWPAFCPGDDVISGCCDVISATFNWHVISATFNWNVISATFKWHVISATFNLHVISATFKWHVSPPLLINYTSSYLN